MIKQEKDGNDVWTPKQIITDSEMKNIRKAHREKFKFLQEDGDTNGKNKRISRIMGCD